MTMRTSYGHEGVDDLSIILFLTVRFNGKGKYMKLKVNLFISPQNLEGLKRIQIRMQESINFEIFS